tara:strand:- start:155 stop:469 length:315 start_codon:yes stop_codon:yes gene_type:complete
MAYLPVNPCCTGVVLNSPCGCNSSTNSCGTNGPLSSTVVYDGPTTPCSNVEACDTLNVALSKIDALLCDLQTQQAQNTQDIAAMKEQIIDINNQITNINNNCCP